MPSARRWGTRQRFKKCFFKSCKYERFAAKKKKKEKCCRVPHRAGTRQTGPKSANRPGHASLLPPLPFSSHLLPRCRASSRASPAHRSSARRRAHSPRPRPCLGARRRRPPETTALPPSPLTLTTGGHRSWSGLAELRIDVSQFLPAAVSSPSSGSTPRRAPDRAR